MTFVGLKLSNIHQIIAQKHVSINNHPY